MPHAEFLCCHSVHGKAVSTRVHHRPKRWSPGGCWIARKILRRAVQEREQSVFGGRLGSGNSGGKRGMVSGHDEGEIGYWGLGEERGRVRERDDH
jgi:hypothetical protein